MLGMRVGEGDKEVKPVREDCGEDCELSERKGREIKEFISLLTEREAKKDAGQCPRGKLSLMRSRVNCKTEATEDPKKRVINGFVMQKFIGRAPRKEEGSLLMIKVAIRMA